MFVLSFPFSAPPPPTPKQKVQHFFCHAPPPNKKNNDKNIAGSGGITMSNFIRLVNDSSDAGCYCSNEELQSLLSNLLPNRPTFGWFSKRYFLKGFSMVFVCNYCSCFFPWGLPCFLWFCICSIDVSIVFAVVFGRIFLFRSLLVWAF